MKSIFLILSVVLNMAYAEANDCSWLLASIKNLASLNSTTHSTDAYSRLVEHLALKLNALNPEQLYFIRNQEKPINPLDHLDIQLSETDKFAVKEAFNKILSNKTKGLEWKKIQTKLDSLIRRSSEVRDERRDEEGNTKPIWTPLLLEKLAPYGYWPDGITVKDGRVFHLLQETGSNKVWLIHEDGIDKKIDLGDGVKSTSLIALVETPQGELRVILGEKSQIRIVNEEGISVYQVPVEKDSLDSTSMSINGYVAPNGHLMVLVASEKYAWQNKPTGNGNSVVSTMYTITSVRRLDTVTGIWEDIKIPVKNEMELVYLKDRARMLAYQAGSITENLDVADITEKPIHIFNVLRPNESPTNVSGRTSRIGEAGPDRFFLAHSLGEDRLGKFIRFYDSQNKSHFDFVPDFSKRERIEDDHGFIKLANGTSVYALDTWINPGRYLTLIDPQTQKISRYSIHSPLSDLDGSTVGIVQVMGDDYAVVQRGFGPVLGISIYNLSQSAEVSFSVKDFNISQIKKIFKLKDGRVVAAVEKDGQEMIMQLFGPIPGGRHD